MPAAPRLLDTNVCIGILKDRDGLIARLRSLAPAEIRVCAVVRAELFYGARKSGRPCCGLVLQHHSRRGAP